MYATKVVNSRTRSDKFYWRKIMWILIKIIYSQMVHIIRNII